jgi:hypothetical protein
MKIPVSFFSPYQIKNGGILMKKIAKKSLSILLAAILAATMLVSAFAVTASSDDIVWFNLDVDYQTNQVYSIAFDVDGYSIFNEEGFACSIFDSDDNEVFDQSMCDIEYYTPGDFEFAEDLGFGGDYEVIFVILNVNEEFIVNPDETYTLVVAEGSFSNADEQLSPELTYSFLPSDYIYVPTIWDKILWFLHSNPVLEFLFARVIVFIELFYYNPLDFWFPMPIF